VTVRPQLLSVPHEGVQHVALRLDLPTDDTDLGHVAYVLAHGAGSRLDAPFLEGVSARLAAGGVPVMRFQYAYMELSARDGRRRPPDRRPVLEVVHRAAIRDAEERFPGRKLLLGGKSMGGRIASYLAAEGETCAGLVFLGYPLHPAGKPDKLRTEHFAALAQPALFVQGARDALCDAKLLETALEVYGGPKTVEIIEDADHGFDVPRRSGRSTDDVLGDVSGRVLRWVRATFPV